MPDIVKNLDKKFLQPAYELFTIHRCKPWSYELFVETLSNHQHFYAIQDETLVGFILLQESIDTIDIDELVVSKLMRRQGIASCLIERVLIYATSNNKQSVLLEVRDDNSGAIALYNGLGFTQISRRKRYYALGNGRTCDALVMQKSLLN